MSSEDIEAVFAEEYVPPHVQFNFEPPEEWVFTRVRKKPKRKRKPKLVVESWERKGDKLIYKPRRRWKAFQDPPVYTGHGRCSMEKIPIPEFTGRRW